mmetsp:Transcript_2333/g.5450  ORF Transcript_2333/g.5450 Transcript_2333/m.5450 type:complete len:352 (+) Transcript_2333:10055-11110(+)
MEGERLLLLRGQESADLRGDRDLSAANYPVRRDRLRGGPWRPSRPPPAWRHPLSLPSPGRLAGRQSEPPPRSVRHLQPPAARRPRRRRSSCWRLSMEGGGHSQRFILQAVRSSCSPAQPPPPRRRRCCSHSDRLWFHRHRLLALRERRGGQAARGHGWRRCSARGGCGDSSGLLLSRVLLASCPAEHHQGPGDEELGVRVRHGHTSLLLLLVRELTVDLEVRAVGIAGRRRLRSPPPGGRGVQPELPPSPPPLPRAPVPPPHHRALVGLCYRSLLPAGGGAEIVFLLSRAARLKARGALLLRLHRCRRAAGQSGDGRKDRKRSDPHARRLQPHHRRQRRGRRTLPHDREPE